MWHFVQILTTLMVTNSWYWFVHISRHDLWYHMSKLSQCIALLLQLTCTSQQPHGYTLLGSGFVSMSQLNMSTARVIKATFSVHKLIPKTLKWLPYILICHGTSLSPWFIILDNNNFVNVSHHYLISGGYQVCLYPMSCGLIGMYWVKCNQTQV